MLTRTKLKWIDKIDEKFQKIVQHPQNVEKLPYNKVRYYLKIIKLEYISEANYHWILRVMKDLNQKCTDILYK
jgi:hypothetical protein